ncbi:MAG TPA: IS66 family insertion sequence element accessory protein TnpB [Xanthobacteraceae bacterium]
MIMSGAGINVLVATKPIDFRKQTDGIAALVQEVLHEKPYSGTIFVFRSKRASRVKLLWWECAAETNREEEGPQR